MRKKYLYGDYLYKNANIDNFTFRRISIKETYQVYQNILYSLQNRDYQFFENVINKDYPKVSKYMKTTINTLREFKEHIKNTFEQPYSNGVMERNNNTCKLIKRIAFGFRNFKNFKARIFFATNIFRKNRIAN